MSGERLAALPFRSQYGQRHCGTARRAEGDACGSDLLQTALTGRRRSHDAVPRRQSVQDLGQSGPGRTCRWGLHNQCKTSDSTPSAHRVPCRGRARGRSQQARSFSASASCPYSRTSRQASVKRINRRNRRSALATR
jgi:hypothetical protein